MMGQALRAEGAAAAGSLLLKPRGPTLDERLLVILVGTVGRICQVCPSSNTVRVLPYRPRPDDLFISLNRPTAEPIGKVGVAFVAICGVHTGDSGI